MDQLSFFSDVPQNELSPAQLQRQARKRAQWRLRQRKCRALRKWSDNLANAPRDIDRTLPQYPTQLVGTIFVSRRWAQRVFDLVTLDDISSDVLRLVFGAAKVVFDAGKIPTRENVLAEIRRSGVIMLHGPDLIDTIIDLTPGRVSELGIHEWVQQLTKAA